MVIRIVILLWIFTINVSAQNWKKISRDVAIEHKKIIGEGERFILHSKVNYYRKLRDKTHFYNVENFHINHNDTFIMIELYPLFDYGRGTIWKYGRNYHDVFSRDYNHNKIVEYFYHNGKIRTMRDYEQMYYDYDFRKMCNDWNFREYEKKQEGAFISGGNTIIATRIIIDGTKYKIYTHQLK